MPGCSSPPVISASIKNRWRLTGSSAWWSRICFSATSRFSSASRATKTAPSPPRACGRRTRNRWPSLVADADGVGCRAVELAVLGRAVGRADVAERRVDLRVADPRQALPRRLAGRNRGQALLHVAAMGFQVNLGQPLQQRPLGGRQVAAALPGGRPGSLDLSSVQAWKAATSWPWLMIPF